MDKNTIGSFLWILVTVVIMLSLLAFASPFGVYIKDNINTFTGEYIEKNDESGKDETTPYCNLTITYKVSDNASKNIPSYKKVLKKYERYSIVSPEVAGYRPNTTVVEGVITSDTNIEVLYTLGIYNIKYITNEGTFASDPRSSYTYKDSFNLPSGTTLKRDNYVFAGWYETKDFEGTKVTKITSTDYGDKLFYAKWIPANYKITYVLNDKASEVASNETTYSGYYYRAKEAKNPEDLAKWDNEVLDSSGKLKSEYTSFNYGSQLKLPVSVSKFGYTFVGWSTEKTGTDKDAYRTQITESDSTDIVLYAQWKRNVYKIEYHLGFTRPDRKFANGTVIKGENAEFDIICDSYTVLDGDGNTTKYSGYPTRYTYGDTITLPSTVYYPGYDQYLGLELWFNKQSEKVIVTKVGNKPSTTSELQKYLGHIKSDSQNIRKNANDSSHQIISPVSSLFSSNNTQSDIDKGRYDHTNLDLYVRPVPNNYYIKFDENKPTDDIYRTGSKTMSNQTLVYDFVSPINPVNFGFSGYEFDSWNTKQDGTGISFKDKADIDLANGQFTEFIKEKGGVLTLYAQWKAVPVTVTFEYYMSNLGVNDSEELNVNNCTIIQNEKYNTITKSYLADSTQTAAEFMTPIDGCTYEKTEQWYKDITKTSNPITYESTLAQPYEYRVLPSGGRVIRYFYRRSAYKLTFVSTPGNMFTQATLLIPRTGETLKLTANTDGSNVEGSIQHVKYGEPLYFTAEYPEVYRNQKWTTTGMDDTMTNSNTYNCYMSYGDTVVTMHNEWNIANVTFYSNEDYYDTNYNEKPHTSWNPTTSQTKTFIYGKAFNDASQTKSGSPGFPSISRQCYEFDGWFTSPTGGNRVYETDIFDYNKHITNLYAHWKHITDTANGCHSWTWTWGQGATCTENGYNDYKCSHCGVTKRETINALGHDLYNVNQSATCIAKGITGTKCSRGDYDDTRETPALGHISYSDNNKKSFSGGCINVSMYGECATTHNTEHSQHNMSGCQACFRKNCVSKCITCYREVTCQRCGHGNYSTQNQYNRGRPQCWCLLHGRTKTLNTERKCRTHAKDGAQAEGVTGCAWK